MKEIINGEIYDTDTAKYICHYPETSAEYGDYLECCYTVYQKETKEFFVDVVLFFERRKEIRYIEPLTNEKAQELCDGLMETDEYTALFGEVEE